MLAQLHLKDGRMARMQNVTVETHYCPLVEIYMQTYGFIPGNRNGKQPVIPLPILKVANNKWHFPLGEDDIAVPIRFCPYCGKDLEDGNS